jgi:ribosomal protein L7/L12
MEGKSHKVVVVFTRDTEQDLIYAKAMNPSMDDSKALGELVLDEIKKSQLNENIAEGDVQVVKIIDNADEVEKQECQSAKYIARAREACRSILTTNVITDEIRKELLTLFEETGNYDNGGTREIKVVSTFAGMSTHIRSRISRQDYDEISAFLNSGHKISAIKRIRELANWGLKEAKDCADNWEH